MSSAGGWVRLIIGVVLSAFVVKDWIFGGILTQWTGILAIVFLVMTAAYFAIRF